MSDRKKLTVEAPSYLRDHQPSPQQLRECLTDEPFTPGEDTQLFRAAYVPESVLPVSVSRVYRFGPPPELYSTHSDMPFWWLYAAPVAETAIWEAQFCKNDVTRPGTFYMDPFAVQNGVIAELRFPRPLRLWNLNGSTASRLGIYDYLSSPDYEWCQWFGYYMDIAMQTVEEAHRPDGFTYPSRRHRGHTAVAISSRVLPALRGGVTRSETPFAEHPDVDRQLQSPPERQLSCPTGQDNCRSLRCRVTALKAPVRCRRCRRLSAAARPVQTVSCISWSQVVSPAARNAEENSQLVARAIVSRLPLGVAPASTIKRVAWPASTTYRSCLKGGGSRAVSLEGKGLRERLRRISFDWSEWTRERICWWCGNKARVDGVFRHNRNLKDPYERRSLFRIT
jgi:hypothetical protein